MSVEEQEKEKGDCGKDVGGVQQVSQQIAIRHDCLAKRTTRKEHGNQP